MAGRLDRTSTLRTAAVLVSFAVASCRTVPHVAPAADHGGTRCYAADRSLVYPLGDTARTSPGNTGAWLVLESEPFAPGATTKKARSVDVLGHEQDGVWWRSGDTLLVQTHDLFTTNSLKLMEDEAGRMRGAGVGTTDVLVQVGNRLEPTEQRWAAELHATDCRRVPTEPAREGRSPGS